MKIFWIHSFFKILLLKYLYLKPNKCIEILSFIKYPLLFET